MMSASSSVDNLMGELEEMINFGDFEDDFDLDAPAIDFSKSSGDIDGEEVEKGDEEKKVDMMKNITASLDEEEEEREENPKGLKPEEPPAQNGSHVSPTTSPDGKQNGTFAIDASTAFDFEPDENQVAAAIAEDDVKDQAEGNEVEDVKDEAKGNVDADVEDQAQEDVATNGAAPQRRNWFWRSASAPVGKMSPVDESSTHSSPPASPKANRARPRQPRQPLPPRPPGRVSQSLRNLRATAAVVDQLEDEKLRMKEEAMDPESIIVSPGCRARTLSISDSHATILLNRIMPRKIREIPASSPDGADGFPSEKSTNEPEIVRALLKLTLAPFHKASLGRKPMTAADYPDQRFTIEELDASAVILSFLSKYKFVLSSDSGGEYSYYDAIPAHSFPPTHREMREVGLVGSLNKALHGFAGAIGGDVAKGAESKAPTINEQVAPSSLDNSLHGGFRVELIAPATDQQIRLEMPKPSSSLVKETPELYDAVTKLYVESIVSGESLDWIQDIVDGKKGTNGILLENEEFFLHIDTEWRSHPDPRVVPLEDWFEHSSVSDLHIIGMLKQAGVASMRDLRAEHIPFLKAMLDDGMRMIHRVYGVDADQIRVFVPYPPQFYRFHMYYTRIDHISDYPVENMHLVDDIIQNLEMDSDFYAKRTVTCKIRVTDELYKRVWLHEVSSETEDGLIDEPVEGDY